MNKREFLKASGALLTGTLVSRFATGEQHAAARTNWSGNYTYSTDQLLQPRSVEEAQHMVKASKRVKALGSRHSFNGIADSTGDQISLKQLDEMKVDPESRTVTVGGGVTYGQLSPYLDQHGFALHNLASLPHISVAGACATATHGSGNRNGNLATVVTALEMITADGTLATFSLAQHGDKFPGAVVALGGLGLVTRLTLKVEPTYQMRQVVYENLPFSELEHHFEEIFESGYSVSLFTDWQHHRVTQAWIKSRVDAGHPAPIPPTFFGATKATRKLHPLAGHSAENCTEQLGIPGPWYERLPHFRMNFTPSSGAELQTEYLLPREAGYRAVLAVEELRDMITPHLFISELRTIAADDMWMSTARQRPSMAIHFTWKPEWPAVHAVLPHIEEKLKPFDARPHWAKLFTTPGSRLHELYTEMPAYRALLRQYDPQGKFHNAFLETNILSA